MPELVPFWTLSSFGWVCFIFVYKKGLWILCSLSFYTFNISTVSVLAITYLVENSWVLLSFLQSFMDTLLPSSCINCCLIHLNYMNHFCKTLFFLVWPVANASKFVSGLNTWYHFFRTEGALSVSYYSLFFLSFCISKCFFSISCAVVFPLGTKRPICQVIFYPPYLYLPPNHFHCLFPVHVLWITSSFPECDKFNI